MQCFAFLTTPYGVEQGRNVTWSEFQQCIIRALLSINNKEFCSIVNRTVTSLVSVPYGGFCNKTLFYNWMKPLCVPPTADYNSLLEQAAANVNYIICPAYGGESE